MLFPTKSDDSLYCKGRFYSQEMAVLASKNGGSWKWFLFLSAPKTFISLITNVFCVILQNSVFRQRITMRWQISAVRAIRIAFLLNLFASIVGAWFITLKPVTLGLFRSSGAIICFHGVRLKRDKSRPYVWRDCFPYAAERDESRPYAGMCRIFLWIIIPNYGKILNSNQFITRHVHIVIRSAFLPLSS